jgi:hypothetical protein
MSLRVMPFVIISSLLVWLLCGCSKRPTEESYNGFTVTEESYNGFTVSIPTDWEIDKTPQHTQGINIFRKYIRSDIPATGIAGVSISKYSYNIPISKVLAHEKEISVKDPDVQTVKYVKAINQFTGINGNGLDKEVILKEDGVLIHWVLFFPDTKSYLSGYEIRVVLIGDRKWGTMGQVDKIVRSIRIQKSGNVPSRATGYGGNLVGKYIAKEITKYSGLTPKPVDDPSYRLPYTNEMVVDAVVIRIEGDHFEPMKRMLGEMLGEPTLYQESSHRLRYDLPNDAVLECWLTWESPDRNLPSHPLVIIRIKPGFK